MKARIAVATLFLAFAASGLCDARQPQPTTTQSGTGAMLERLRDINLTEAQEAAIAGIREEFAPKIDDAVAMLTSVVKEEVTQARAVLTPEQLQKLQTMKEEGKILGFEGLASRIAHLRDLDLTEEESAKITAIRKEYRPKIIKALETLKGTLTPEQARIREDGLKAGKSRREVLASLKLNDEQKTKVEAVGKEVRAIVREELEKMRDVINPAQKEKVAGMKADRPEFIRDRIAFAIASFKELNLTDEQKVKIEAIRAEYAPRVQEAGNRVRAIVREELWAIMEVLKA